MNISIRNGNVIDESMDFRDYDLHYRARGTPMEVLE